MGRKSYEVGVVFYRKIDRSFITTESALKQPKSDIASRRQWDPLDIFLARHITNSPVITIDGEVAVNFLAELMEKHRIGCVIVTTEEGKPMGIITGRDLATKVVARNLKPEKITAKDVMTSPIVMVEPEVPIRRLTNMMSQLRIGKLGVIYKGQLVGIISQSDIMALLPKMTEILEEVPEWALQRTGYR